MVKRVLIADDDKLILAMVAATLRKNGFEVITAIDGEEAIEIAMTCCFDLIITDILMPEIEGIEVISEIIDKFPETKIIAISAEGRAGFTNFLTIAETVGATASLKKPFTPSQLMDKINSLGL